MPIIIRALIKALVTAKKLALRFRRRAIYLVNSEERHLSKCEKLLKKGLTRELLANHESKNPRFRNKPAKQRYLLLLTNAYELEGNYLRATETLLESQMSYQPSISQWKRLLTLEQQANSSLVFSYVQDNQEKLPPLSKHFLASEYCCFYEQVEPDWSAALAIAQKKYNALFTNSLINAAFIRNQKWVLDAIEKLLFHNLNLLNKMQRLRSFRQLSSIYYKTGSRRNSLSLAKKINFKDHSWKLNISLGSRDPVSALKYRSDLLGSNFLRLYKQKKAGSAKKTLLPEKDLCGDVFMPFFFKNEYKNHGSFRVICDKRMITIHQRSFPYLDFVPKTPARKINLEPEKFKGVPIALARFIDSNVQNKINDSKFFTIDAREHFQSSCCQLNRATGWLKPSPDRVGYWQNFINGMGTKHTIGFCAGSTVSTPNRDIHMVPLKYWDHIFKIENCTFINLNAALSQDDCRSLAAQHNSSIITPDFDLYNDFENLLALMSCLDYAIVPSNNMMDMAASVGTDTIVFSPTGIMSGWIPDGHDNYVFSDHVHFLTPENSDGTKPGMISKAVEIITHKLKMNRPHGKNETPDEI